MGDRYLTGHVDRWREYARAQQVKIRRRRERNSYFHRCINRLIAANVVPDSVVIDVGCSDGLTLAACEPGVAVGIDIDADALESARERFPEGTFVDQAVEEWKPEEGLAPDYIVASLLLDQVYDVHTVLQEFRSWSVPDTRVIITTYSRLWQPAIRLAEAIGMKTKAPGENYMPWAEVENLLEQSDFEVVHRLDGVLIPVHIPLLAPLVNRWLAPLPVLRAFAMVRVTVARPVSRAPRPVESVSIIVAARNESGHIRELIRRVPMLAPRQEVVFVEGNSTDDTWDEIQAAAADMAADLPFPIIALQQPGKGKGDAVRAGFAAATGDVLMILDADISVPPEELPRFIEALEQDHCEFANGSRLVYPMDDKAMRFLNLLGNRFFGVLFSFLLGQQIRDTLCGTKVLRREHYDAIAANRSVFGDFDPFGDFDLLFGAARLGMKIRDIPVHYKERVYGETNISRFSSGWLLLRMSHVAAKRLKYIG